MWSVLDPRIGQLPLCIIPGFEKDAMITGCCCSSVYANTAAIRSVPRQLYVTDCHIKLGQFGAIVNLTVSGVRKIGTAGIPIEYCPFT